MSQALCSALWMCLGSFNPHSKPLRQVLILSPFPRRAQRDLEMLKVTQLVLGGIEPVWLGACVPSHPPSE